MNRYNRYQQPQCAQRQTFGMAMPDQSEPCAIMPLAVPFVQWQRWESVFDPDTALRHGTIFPELDLPFCGSGVRQG